MQLGSTLAEALPKKRALLIGINYALTPAQRTNSATTDGSGELKGCHVDVCKMKDLVMNVYHYSPDDVVTLIDDGGDSLSQPTRENILRELDNLVRDAKSGDHFFFHYSGHAGQLRCDDNTEEDGLDECQIFAQFILRALADKVTGLLPTDAQGDGKSDHEELMIRDNDLRTRLVDRLPPGSQLVAVFDACHSGTLLDLEHSHCNRVLPNVSKSRRRSRTLYSQNVRKNALTSSRTQARRVTVSINKSIIRDQVVVQTQKPSLDSKTAYDPCVSPTSPTQVCESPVSTFACNGRCKFSPVDDDGKAKVISLSCCQDSQLAWEVRGSSMTAVLVKVLEKNPNPLLRNLILCVSHELFKTSLNAHDEARNYLKAFRVYRERGGKDPEVPVDTNSFQDPQLSSLRPLNLDKTCWNP